MNYSTKQTCLVWMMPNTKLRHTFNRSYASLPLPRWSFLSPIEAAIKNMDSTVTRPLKQKSEGSRVPDYKRVRELELSDFL